MGKDVGTGDEYFNQIKGGVITSIDGTYEMYNAILNILTHS